MIEKEVSWYLIHSRPGKRDLFVKQLNQLIKNNQLEDLISSVLSPKEPIYKDMVFVQLADLKTGRLHLQKIEYFLKIEPLSYTRCTNTENNGFVALHSQIINLCTALSAINT